MSGPPRTPPGRGGLPALAQAQAAHRDGRLADAERAYRALLAGAPDDPDVLHLLGLALAQQRRYADALEPLQRAAALRPDQAEIQHHLGLALRDIGRVQEAIGHLDQAVQLKPSFAAGHFHLGNALRDLGRMDEALASYRRALAIDPIYAEVYTNYGLVRRLSDDADICRLLGQAARRIESLPPPRRTHLHLALARLHDERDEIDEAFRHWREAAVLKRRSLSYDPTQTDALVARMQGAFPPGPWAASRDHGAPSVLPIFVLGMPRSGTTLIEQILASHPQVHGGGELGLLPKALAGLDANAETLARPGPFAGGPELVRRGEDYVAAMQALASGVTRITDKRPANALLIGPLHLVLPRTAVILCRRDLVDTCLSCFQTLFRQGHDWSYDLAELGHYARAHDRLMDHWRAVLPGRVLEVRYEELVSDPEAGARRIVAHCGLSWDAACLSLDGAGRAVRTASVGQVRQQIHTRAVGRWRRYEHHLKPLLDALGSRAHQG